MQRLLQRLWWLLLLRPILLIGGSYYRVFASALGVFYWEDLLRRRLIAFLYSVLIISKCIDLIVYIAKVPEMTLVELLFLMYIVLLMLTIIFYDLVPIVVQFVQTSKRDRVYSEDIVMLYKVRPSIDLVEISNLRYSCVIVEELIFKISEKINVNINYRARAINLIEYYGSIDFYTY